MLIGIISDTHDRAEITKSALSLLRDAGAEFFIHCGDVCSEPILDLFAGLPCAIVWGNNDSDRAALTRYAADLGVDCRGDFARLELAGKIIAVTHGDNYQLLRRAVMPGQFDYLLHGHTHAARDERMGKLRIINPGALHRAARKTVATLNLKSDVLKFLAVAAP